MAEAGNYLYFAAYSVANAGAYRWSSFSANATGRENVMITPHPVYQKLGDTQEARAYAYRKSFDEEPEGVDRSVIDEEIRSATRQGVLIAGTTYAADVARRLNREVTAKPRGRPKKKGPEKGARKRGLKKGSDPLFPYLLE